MGPPPGGRLPDHRVRRAGAGMGSAGCARTSVRGGLHRPARRTRVAGTDAGRRLPRALRPSRPMVHGALVQGVWSFDRRATSGGCPAADRHRVGSAPTAAAVGTQRGHGRSSGHVDHRLFGRHPGGGRLVVRAGRGAVGRASAPGGTTGPVGRRANKGAVGNVLNPGSVCSSCRCGAAVWSGPGVPSRPGPGRGVGRGRGAVGRTQPRPSGERGPRCWAGLPPVWRPWRPTR